MGDPDAYLDDSIIKQIFVANQPQTITIFLQDWGKCVFKAEFQGSHPACVVRLEAVYEGESSETFATVAAFQQIASTVIPELVPKTFKIGKAQNSENRVFQFSVIDFVKGELLEDVWSKMNPEEQKSVVTELVEALKKLHSVQLSDTWAQDVLSEALREAGDEFLKSFKQAGALGGPLTGFLRDGPALLHAIMEHRKLPNRSFCHMEPIIDSQDFRIYSNYDELGSMVLSWSDIEKWPQDTVLCHNDLTTRNILLRPHLNSEGKFEYKLAGIIDWECAGFYPASYELNLQDTYLGSSNRHATYYLALKKYMKTAVPRSSSQLVLLQAMDLIFESQQRLLTDGTNIPAHIRKQFIKISGLTRHEDPYVGWTRRPQDGPFPEYSRASMEKLEDDVVEEMLTRRRSHAN